jgi:RNA polymerase sigma-70 factor (ECF subfamily)
MRRVCSASQGAAEQLVARYGDHVLRIVRRKLNRALRAKFDSVDFVQAVWASFFALPLENYQFENSEALVAFLTGLARHKVVDTVRQRLQSQKYDVNREQPLSEPRHSAMALRGRQPTPSEIAMAREEWQLLLAGQPEHYQEILLALRDGRTQQDVARHLGVNERTVRRVLRKLAPGKPHDAR